MKLSRFAITNNQFTVVLIVLLSLMGLGALQSIPRSEDPQISEPTISIRAVYPGTSPQDIEHLLITPLETALNELEHIERIESVARDGYALVLIDFTFGQDPAEKYTDVLRKVQSVLPDLPADLQRIDVEKFSIADYTNILQIALSSNDVSLSALEIEAELLKNRIERVPGIKKVRMRGVPDEEIRVSLDLERMATLRVPLGLVMQTLQSANTTIPGGKIVAGDREFNVRTGGSISSMEELEDLAVRTDSGGLLRIRDIATVTRTRADATYRARVDGVPCIYLTATQKEQTDINAVMAEVQKIVDAFSARLPETIEATLVFNQAESVASRLNGFALSLAQGVLLVGVVMLLVLGARISLIVIIAIPLSVLIGLAGLEAAGFGLEQMSIAGFVIALGLLVDNAIVVTENVSRFGRKGYAAAEAAIRGTGQIGWAIISSTATTVLAFLPILLMQNVSGEFIRGMPASVVFTLVASLLVSLTLTPLLTSRFLSTGTNSVNSPGQRALSRFVDGHYVKWLRTSLHRPARTLTAAFIVFFMALGLAPFVGVSFFPKAEKPQFLVNIDTGAGTTLDRTDAISAGLENYLIRHRAVRHVAANIGEANPPIYYNMHKRTPASNVAQLYVRLHKGEYDAMASLITDLRGMAKTLPEARVDVKEFAQGPPVDAPVELHVIGPDLQELSRFAARIEAIMAERPGIVNVENPIASPKIDFEIIVDRDKAGLLALRPDEIDRTVRASLSGLPVAKLRESARDDVPIVVRLPLSGQPGMREFERIYVASKTGQMIPLNQFSEIAFAGGYREIGHFQLERSVTLKADVLEGHDIGEVTLAILDEAAKLSPGDAYRIEYSGELASRQESFGGMGRAILIAMVAIFGVLVLQFRSFAQPLIVFTAIPLALVGAILGLLLSGNSFSFTAFVGLTSLVGIVVNNSIILVDYTNQLRREGAEMQEALLEAGRTRFVPIVLTGATTIGGLLPLTLQGGSMWAPLGWTIIGGLTVSTLLTLIVVPVLYRLYTPELVAKVEEDVPVTVV